MRQDELGQRLNIGKGAVSRYELGKRYPDPPTICALCDIFGCTADYLLGRSDTPWPAVTPEQTELYQTYEALPPEIRQAVDGLMAPYRKHKKIETA
jgi:transcriptional regulator with XRE-family HTH domain